MYDDTDYFWLACTTLILLLLLFLTAGCSTANNWRPPVAREPVHHVQVCVQYGSKLYDRDTGEECLTREQERRKERARCKTPVECAKS